MSDKKDTVLDKVRKLINLAASPNLKEAERAAYKACALIREARLDVCDPAEIDAIYGSLAAEEAKVRQLSEKLKDPMGFEALGNSLRNAAQAVGHYSTSGASGGNPVYAGSSPTPAQPKPMTHPVKLKSNFAGRCKFCSKPYKQGDEILWIKSQGTWCPTSSCYNDWKIAQGFTPYATP